MFPWILVVQTVLWVQVLPVKKPQVYCNNLDNNLLRIQYFYWCKSSMGQRVSFPEQWAYCCQTAFVLYVCFIRTLPSHHWVLQVLMVQWDLVLPVDRKEMWLGIFAHHHHSSLTETCAVTSANRFLSTSIDKS